MRVYDITGMAEKLVKDGCVEDIKEARAIASLTEYWTDSIALVWTVTDIIRISERRTGDTIDRKEAKIILDRVYKNHRPEIGVSIFVIIKELRKLEEERCME